MESEEGERARAERKKRTLHDCSWREETSAPAVVQAVQQRRSKGRRSTANHCAPHCTQGAGAPLLVTGVGAAAARLNRRHVWARRSVTHAYIRELRVEEEACHRAVCMHATDSLCTRSRITRSAECHVDQSILAQIHAHRASARGAAGTGPSRTRPVGQARLRSRRLMAGIQRQQTLGAQGAPGSPASLAFRSARVFCASSAFLNPGRGGGGKGPWYLLRDPPLKHLDPGQRLEVYRGHKTLAASACWGACSEEESRASGGGFIGSHPPPGQHRPACPLRACTAPTR